MLCVACVLRAVQDKAGVEVTSRMLWYISGKQTAIVTPNAHAIAAATVQAVCIFFWTRIVLVGTSTYDDQAACSPPLLMTAASSSALASKAPTWDLSTSWHAVMDLQDAATHCGMGLQEKDQQHSPHPSASPR